MPKRRCRTGCTPCRGKKKKCDEATPRCSRCSAHGEKCVYDSIRPRDGHDRVVGSEITSREGNASLAIASQSPPDLVTSDPYSPTVSRDLHCEHLRRVKAALQNAQTNFTDSAQQPLDARVVEQGGQRAFATFMKHFADDSHGEGASMPSISIMEDLAVAPLTAAAMVDTFSANGASLSRQGNADEYETGLCQSPLARQCDLHPDLHTVVLHGPCEVPMAPGSVRSPLLEFTAPAFEEFSPQPNCRALIAHFCNALSPLFVFRAENGNPFRQLVLPLLQRSPVIEYAIYALASAHLERQGVCDGSRSVHFHTQALRATIKMLEDDYDTSKNDLLSVVTLLTYYEALFQPGRSKGVSMHLKGAMAIMENRPSASGDGTTTFLERALYFHDVIAALSLGTVPFYSVLNQTSVPLFLPLDAQGTVSETGSADAILGMFGTLWPTMHRLSTLQELKDELNKAVKTGDKSKTAVLRAEFEVSIAGMKLALSNWQPTYPPSWMLTTSFDEVPPTRLSERRRLLSLRNTAFAYQQSALIYLYRTLCNIRRDSRIVQLHTHRSLAYCSGTVHNDGPMGALLWPLFVADCEARDPSDRTQAMHAFEVLTLRQGTLNTEQAYCIVKEVWRRVDKIDAGEHITNNAALPLASSDEIAGLELDNGNNLWRIVCNDMGISIVLS